VRLFVAVYPPADACADLGAVVARLAVGQPQEPGHSLGLQPPDRWHITLAFLGEVPDKRLDNAREAVRSAVQTGPAPALRVAGGGHFGRRRFVTLWAGVRGELDALGDLAGAVRRELRRARLPYDRKPLRPHLTLARPGERLAPDLLAALDAYEGPLWTVEEVRLVRSYPGPHPVYEPVGQFTLTPRGST
jgi:2'-5' RNA ligase